MTAEQIQSRLTGLGATPYEAELLAAIIHFNGWHTQPASKVTNEQRDALQTWLADFRAERYEQAVLNLKIRQNAESAGYRVHPCSHRRAIIRPQGGMCCESCGFLAVPTPTNGTQWYEIDKQ